jgi:hypothetical protein
MNDPARRNHYDVSDRVFLADPRQVCSHIGGILRQLDPAVDLAPLQRAFDIFSRLYCGRLPGYRGCETPYHDTRHSLDCALAFARLVDGHDRSVVAGARLGVRRAVLGVIAALFHDCGYIRKDGDTVHHGAELTPVHVRRSGDFLARILPPLGFGEEAGMVEHLVHFTGYEVPLDAIPVTAWRDRRLGFMLGSADMLAQMSDRCYLEKCRDFLYPEFEMCGLAGRAREGGPSPLYGSAEELLARTSAFRDQVWAERMDGTFESVYRYAAVHFGGRNLYLEAIDGQFRRLQQAQEAGALITALRRRTESIDAVALRAILGPRLRPAVALARRLKKHSRRRRGTAAKFVYTRG